MNRNTVLSFERRGREQGARSRPLLVLSRGQDPDNHINKNQNKKPLTQIPLQNLEFG